MGWIGDLWSSVKQKATSIYDTAKETASNWMSGKYLAPGYSYCCLLYTSDAADE